MSQEFIFYQTKIGQNLLKLFEQSLTAKTASLEDILVVNTALSKAHDLKEVQMILKLFSVSYSFLKPLLWPWPYQKQNVS